MGVLTIIDLLRRRGLRAATGDFGDTFDVADGCERRLGDRRRHLKAANGARADRMRLSWASRLLPFVSGGWHCPAAPWRWAMVLE